MQTICIDGQCLKNYPNGFKWKKNISEFDEEFINNYDEDIDKGYIIEEDINYRKNLRDLDSDLPFLQEIMEINKCNKLVCNLYDRECKKSHKILS